MPQLFERLVFIVHGVITLAAAVVLVAFPALIPSTVGIRLETEQNLLSYFLAAAELAIGVLSLGAAWLRDPNAIRLIALSFAVFHGATAILEIAYLITTGMSAALIGNIVVRVIVTALFIVIAQGRRTLREVKQTK